MPQTYARDPDWWKDRTVYQIYPRSFRDTDGDGVGDIPGIISKLDYLADLGIGIIWLSPIYASPMADNGYDISDYRDIAPEFGTLADFDRLIEEAGKRDIGIMMDLVVNHTSDRHEWFQAARASRNDPKRDFYIWRDPGPDGGLPNDLRSMFGGPAWTWDETAGQYYLHLFAKEQPDLNWSNPEMRAEVHDMMNWWLDKGIAGFRMDVIDVIGKEIDEGVLQDGPNLHRYIHEMHENTLKGRNVVTVGEAWSATPETALLYSGRERDELSMIFQFEHVTTQMDEEHGKWRPKPFSLPVFKAVLNKWQTALAEDGWNSLFLNNHDLPRSVSKYGDPQRFWRESATMLATVTHLMKGTPYVYQGEEIGMTNAGFTALHQYRDVETLNFYEERVAAGDDPVAFLLGAAANGRDNARTPMQWTAGDQAGFTSGTPWIEVNTNHTDINVEAQESDEASVLAHYRRLITLRRQYPLIVHGDYKPYFEEDEQLFVYARDHEGERMVVAANFSGEPAQMTVPADLEISGKCLISNHKPRDTLGGSMTLEPYEALAILKQ